VGALADGVIVGSALIDVMAGKRGADAAHAAGTYVRSLRAALPKR
jgi:tryptophan synthase alpha subunit